MKRENFGSGGRWEASIGYSRVVRVGDLVFVAGTTAADANGVVLGDAYAQTVKTLEKIALALEGAGASLRDVVRTRMFLKDMRDADAVGRAHGECFKDIRPVASMLAVAAMIVPEMLVEIEVDAVVGAG